MMVHSEICPVCKGTGKYKKELKDVCTLKEETCHGCNGRGWVEVGRDDYWFPRPNGVPSSTVPYVPPQPWIITWWA